jgi:hypothetical protein
MGTFFGKSLLQLREQKGELVRETLDIITKMGLSENIHTYVSIGDSGKIVLRLKKALSIPLKTRELQIFVFVFVSYVFVFVFV